MLRLIGPHTCVLRLPSGRPCCAAYVLAQASERSRTELPGRRQKKENARWIFLGRTECLSHQAHQPAGGAWAVPSAGPAKSASPPVVPELPFFPVRFPRGGTAVALRPASLQLPHLPARVPAPARQPACLLLRRLPVCLARLFLNLLGCFDVHVPLNADGPCSSMCRNAREAANAANSVTQPPPSIRQIPTKRSGESQRSTSIRCQPTCSTNAGRYVHVHKKPLRCPLLQESGSLTCKCTCTSQRLKVVGGQMCLAAPTSGSHHMSNLPVARSAYNIIPLEGQQLHVR